MALQALKFVNSVKDKTSLDLLNPSDHYLNGVSAVIGSVILGGMLFGSGGILMARHILKMKSETEYLTTEGKAFAVRSAVIGAAITAFLQATTQASK